MSAAGISIQGVNVSYGDNHVLKDVSLEIAPGEFFAFLGPSGCGKTTLLRLIAGFVQADSGSVRVGGADITRLPPWKRDVGLVFQNYALWPHLSVRRNVAFGLEERRLPRAEIERRVDGALEVVGLSALGERKPSQLSGGQQQRVALARTLAVEPKVLLLDEPLSNLDAKLRVQVRRELRDLQRRLGLTTIFVTHDQEEANTVCDRIAVMSEGVVQQVGTPMGLYTRPANLFVAGFLGSANILDGEVAGHGAARRFEIRGGGSLPLPGETPALPGARLVFRPQDVRLVEDASADAVLQGRVVDREFLGSSVRYGVEVGVSEITVDVPFRAGDTPRESGAEVRLALRPQAALLLPP
jgi:iron(III) transport system ATP-binding protein